MNIKKLFLISMFFSKFSYTGLEMNFAPGLENKGFGMGEGKSLGFGNAFIIPAQNPMLQGQEIKLTKEEMEGMQNAFYEMFDKIPESELIEMCNEAVSIAEAEARSKGQTLNEYLDSQFAQLNEVMPNEPAQLFAKANFEKDSSTSSDASKDSKKTDDDGSKSEAKVVEQTTTSYGSDLAGNWLNKRSYAVESKTLIARAQQDIEKIAEQKLKLLDQIKSVDDALGKFYKESGTEIGKTLAKSPEKKAQSPSFAIEAFLNEQLQKLEDSKNVDSKSTSEEKEEGSKPDLGVITYKIELVANECRKIVDTIKSEIKKLQELEKTLAKRSEKVEKNAQEASDKFKATSDKAKQIDHTYNDVTAQKLYSEVEQFQQHISLIKQFMESDESSNISALKSALDSTAQSIMGQLKRMNEKVTSVLNPFKESL